MLRSYRSIILFFLFLSYSVFCIGQVNTAIIPYKVVGDKIVIEMIINGKTVPLIFDTGGKNAITSELQKELGLSVSSVKEVMDVNSTRKKIQVVQVSKLESTDHRLIFNEVPILILDTDFFKCYGDARGLIGNDLFKNCLVEIDDARKQIRLIRGGKGMSAEKFKHAIPFADTTMRTPIFPIRIGKTNDIIVLFDTGSPLFLSIKNSDAEKLLKDNSVKLKWKGEGIGPVGVNGYSSKRILSLLQMSTVNVGNTRFSQFHGEVGNSPYTLLGYNFMKHGKVTLDFINNAFHFEPYSNGIIEDIRKKWNLAMSVRDNHSVVVASVWDNLVGKVDIGDVVTLIDGKKVPPFTFCESITTGMGLLKDTRKLTLTIENEYGIRDIIIEKK